MGMDLTLPLFLATLGAMSYPGGKSGEGVYHKLINLMPPHDVYVEPFLGGGGLMLAKRPARLNIGVELNRDVAREWQRLDLVTASKTAARAQAAAAAADNGGTAGRIARNDGAAGAPKMTASAAEFGNDRSRAASSAGRRRQVSPVPATLDPDAAENGGEGLSFQFLQGDGVDFLKSYPFTGAELVYCDPPYLLSTRSSGRLYAHEMTDTQHRELLATIKRLPCMVMISGYSSPMYAAALEDWNSMHFEAMTRGGLATEWLWYNFQRPLALHDYRYLGTDRRQREQLKRKKERWSSALERMPALERQVLLCSLTGDRRERERIKRKRERWTARINRMPLLERQALLGAIASAAVNGAGGPPPELSAVASAAGNGGRIRRSGSFSSR